VHLAWWALGQEEFYNHVMDYAQDRAFKDSVNAIRLTMSGTSRDLHVGWRTATNGDAGEAGGDQPPNFPKIADRSIGLPVLGGLQQYEIVGSVSWKIDFSYLEYNFYAQLNLSKGDPSRFMLSVRGGPPWQHDTTGGLQDNVSADQPISVSGASLFGASPQQVQLTLSANIGGEPVGIACAIPGACEASDSDSTTLYLAQQMTNFLQPYGGP
jgi:hypothetical protein